MNFDQVEVLTPLVERIFTVEDMTLGEKPVVVRYGGRLRSADSAAAYDQLSEWLKPYHLTPYFYAEEGRQVVMLAEEVQIAPSNPRINLIMFVLTFFSVWLTGAMISTDGDPFANGVNLSVLLGMAWNGLPYTISLLAILVAHEFGHYLMGRKHGTPVTLPYLIPFPFSAFGTLGAFINMKDQPKNKRDLLDIGLAGPLSGLAVAIPVLVVGLALSRVVPTPLSFPAGEGIQFEGNSLLYLLVKYLMFGQLLPAPASYGDVPPLLYWLGYFFTGSPVPLGGVDVQLHSVAWAGWAGLLVTAMNLIPAGQLDGGHVLYTLVGERNAKKIFWGILAAMLLLGVAWNGWWLWAGLIFLMGRAFAQPRDQITELDGRRKVLAVLALILLVLVFIPVPIILVMGS
ncbi:MAG TPA: site-2 protease family protein [Anaerolineaceae bacterium]|nr:site-2 protease family protein [Anaerolineaceae bacterium]HPN53305.1 site-2 protease family protein [Anaerolineaceae bacterium]